MYLDEMAEISNKKRQVAQVIDSQKSQDPQVVDKDNRGTREDWL